MPLYSLATCKIEKRTKFEEVWENSWKIKQAFEDSKTLLTRAIRLNIPDPQAPLALTCDASQGALGATLEQFVKGAWRPLALWSKSLKPDKQKWVSFRRETLAVQQALRYFHDDIAGRHVTVFSDCKALVHMFQSPTSQDPDPHAKAHLIEIGQWTKDVRRIDAKRNQMADYLSGSEVLGSSYTNEEAAWVKLESLKYPIMCNLRVHRAHCFSSSSYCTLMPTRNTCNNYFAEESQAVNINIVLFS